MDSRMLNLPRGLFDDALEDFHLHCEVMEDPPCLKPFLNGKHELLASVNIFPCPKPCVQTRIHPIDLEFLEFVVQCLINLLQSAVTELVELIDLGHVLF
ncbi:hypothetical protein Tco_1091770 [Tanacetum coccineum]|uniref:Uncharacterized protein n=1 Tax=Tanacetum coccineum TaxID=301880 RepID=A0ABQ5I9V4_9ASTR